MKSAPHRSPPRLFIISTCFAVLNRCAGTSEAWRCIKANQFFFSPLLFVLREKDVSKVIFAALFCFFIWQAEQCAMRVMAIACPLSTSRSRGCQKERRSLCHSRSSARQLHLWLSTRHFQSFPFSFFLFIDRIFRLFLLFTWNRFIFVHPWESVFGGCVLYPWNCWEIQMAWWTIFWNRNEKIQFGSSSHPPCIFPLCWTRLMSFHLSEMASSAPTRNPRLFTTRHHHHHRLLLLVF